MAPQCPDWKASRTDAASRLRSGWAQGSCSLHAFLWFREDTAARPRTKSASCVQLLAPQKTENKSIALLWRKDCYGCCKIKRSPASLSRRSDSSRQSPASNFLKLSENTKPNPETPQQRTSWDTSPEPISERTGKSRRHTCPNRALKQQRLSSISPARRAPSAPSLRQPPRHPWRRSIWPLTLDFWVENHQPETLRLLPIFLARPPSSRRDRDSTLHCALPTNPSSRPTGTDQRYQTTDRLQIDRQSPGA